MDPPLDLSVTNAVLPGRITGTAPPSVRPALHPMATDPFTRPPSRPSPSGVRLVFGPFRFDRRSRLLFRGDEELPLPPRALAVLDRLLESPGEVVSKDALLQAGWEDVHVGDRSLSEAVGLVRQTLDDDAQEPRYVQTVHRRGYRFVAPVALEATGRSGWPAEVEAPPEGSIGPRPAGAPADGLDPAVSGPVEAAVPDRAPRRSARRRRSWAFGLAVGLLVLAGLAALVAVVGHLRRPAAEPAGPTRFAVHPPAGAVLAAKGAAVALSPDGRTLAFVALGEGAPGDDAGGKSDRRWQIFLRPLGSLEARSLPGTEGGYAPFFSPDGRWLAYFDGHELKRIPVDGGGAQTLAEAHLGTAGAWGADGTIVFADHFRTLKAIDPVTGAIRRVAAPDPALRERGFNSVDLLPDGRRALVGIWRSSVESSAVALLDLATGERREILDAAISPRVLPDGRILWVGPDGLMAAPFDLERGEPSGPARLVADGVAVDHLSGVAQYAVSRSGVLAYGPAPAFPEERRIVTVGPDGAVVPLDLPERYYRNLAVSPDGRRFAATLFEPPRSDVWVGAVDGTGPLRRLTFEAFDIEPVWSPDGASVTFASDRGGALAVYRIAVDGGGEPELVVGGERSRAPVAWSPDGRTLVFAELHPETGADLWLLRLPEAGAPPAEGEVRPFVRTPRDEFHAAFSPDGRWLAYSSDSGPVREVFVRSLEGAGPWQVSAGGGWNPTWSEDGRRILFGRGDRIVAVPVGDDPPVPVGPEEVVLETSDVSPLKALPGGRFLGIRPERSAGPEPSRPVHVVLDWPALLD